MSPQRDGRRGPSVTERVLGILSAFGPGAETLSLAAIARTTGLPLSTAHRLVGELAGWGALERDADGRYRIGLRLWEVGALAPRSLGLRERAMPHLEDLYEATRQNVQLAVRDEHDAVYVERLAHPDAVRVLTRVGGRMPLHATAVGQILLAFAPASVQEDVLAGPLPALTSRTVTDPLALRRTLAGVRREGVAVCDGMVDVLSLSVAAPVRGEDDGVVAAISVVVPSAGSDPRAVVPAVRATARGISRALGSPAARRRPAGVVTPMATERTPDSSRRPTGGRDGGSVPHGTPTRRRENAPVRVSSGRPSGEPRPMVDERPGPGARGAPPTCHAGEVRSSLPSTDEPVGHDHPPLGSPCA